MLKFCRALEVTIIISYQNEIKWTNLTNKINEIEPKSSSQLNQLGNMSMKFSLWDMYLQKKHWHYILIAIEFMEKL